MVVTLKETKNYLRIDFEDDDSLIRQLINTAQNLCMEIVRIEDKKVFEYNAKAYKTAVLYAVAYLYENREKANHNELKLTLRALLANYRTEDF